MPKTTEPIAYEDAVDLLDADHKLVKKLFIDYSALVEDSAPAQAKRAIALKICDALSVHATIEEEVFYPAVRKFIMDDSLMDEAHEEHAEAKSLIAEIQGLKQANAKQDQLVKQLGDAIDEHVLEEREQIFMKARYAPMDLKALVIPLLAARQETTKKSSTKQSKESA